MSRPISDIPVGTQFSPDLTNLEEFIKAITAYGGDRLAMQKAIWVPPVHRKRNGIPDSRRNANLPLEAAVQYGLLEKGTYAVTSLSRQLSTLSGQQLYDESLA